jgi:2,4-dienoyl-CoA reductase-like NADH-dependent reductase (Old Yellow Enzyme family)
VSGASVLFSPLEVGSLTLKNRFVSPPHGTYFAEDGLVSDRQLDYYETLARGGVGMIVTGSWAVWPRTMPNSLTNRAVDPRAAAGHRRLARTVHAYDVALLAQLHESGRQGYSGAHRGPLLAPSPLPDPVVREVPKEMEHAEIEELVDHFVRAAVAMREAGWDGVEVFAAQGYGLAQFLSPQMNHRLDEFGGGLEGRSRLLCTVLERVRAAVGPDWVVGVRMNGSDCVPGGAELSDAVALATLLCATGEVDYLSISGASNETYPLWIADMGHPPGLFVDLAAEIRRSVDRPVLVTTRITTASQAEQIVASGAADLVGMNRALIADPELPAKARRGADGEIRPCVGSNQGCIGRIVSGASMRCTVNPRVGEPRGQEGLVTPRRIVVVGAGPAGLEAAVTAAERGHGVTLLEAGAEIGGQLALAAQVPSRSEFGRIVDHLRAELARLGVEVRLGHAADVATVRALSPEEVVLATGSRPIRTGYSTAFPGRPVLPGHDRPHVLTATEVFARRDAIARRVVVLDDDPHGQATTVAELLAPDHEVTLVCRSTSVGLWGGPANQEFLYTRLQQGAVRILSSTWASAIEPAEVVCHPTHAPDDLFRLAADTVVVATGNRVVDDLYHDLVDQLPGVPVHRVGDCLAPRLLDHAFWDGYRVATAIGRTP